MNRISARTFTAFFLLIPLMLSLFVCNSEAQDNVIKQFSEGLVKEAEGDYLSAIFVFQDVLKINPYFFDAKIALARCLFKTGNLGESERLLLEALKQERNNVAARNILGRVLISQKKFKEAEEVFKAALEIEPVNIETKYGLADLYRAKGDYKSAISLYNEILKVYPQEVWTYIYLGTSYTEMKHLERAGGFFRKAVSLDSQSPWTHINLARHYYQMGLKKSGIEPATSEKFFDAAVYEAETALHIENRTPEAYKILLSVYFFNKDYQKALDAGQNILKLRGENYLLLYDLGLSYELLGNPKKAEEYYSKALSKRIDDEITRFRLENTVLGLYSHSLSEKKRLELSEFHFSKARFYLDKNVMKKAFLQYKRAVQLDPVNPEQRLELAELMRIRHSYELYLYELKEIIRDTLDIDTIDINDRIEIYASRVSKNLASSWRVEQYLEDENSPDFIPRTKISVAVFDGFITDNIYENFLHKRLSMTLSEMLSQVLLSYPKIEAFHPQSEVLTRQDALKKARSLGVDYYITGVVEEKEDSLKVMLNLLSGFNGKVQKTFETYFTGNDKLFHTVVSLAEDINTSIPLRGLIVRMEGDRALINIGESHGVKKDMTFHIIREGGLKKNPETGDYVFDPDVSLGSLIVTKIDEMVSEGVYTYSGLYNRVNMYDNVMLKAEEEKDKEAGKKNKKQ
ncbi:Beta-barrel assembly-enhancing protease [subsurface metagenome]